MSWIHLFFTRPKCICKRIVFQHFSLENLSGQICKMLSNDLNVFPQIDESEEGEDLCEAPIIEPSDTHESSASSPATFAREPESRAEHHEEAQQRSPAPEEERPQPSSTASNAHVFMFDSESQEQNHSQTRGTPVETFSRVLEDKEHIKTLMRETKKDLVEVTKALLKASGDLTSARVYLLDGYEREIHGPLWNHLDDEILLLADPYELEQLQSKFGEEEVTRRRAFLTACKN